MLTPARPTTAASLTRHSQHLIAGPEDAEQRARDGVGAREDLDAHHRRLGAHQLRVDAVERLSAEVAVAVTVHATKQVGAHVVLAVHVQHTAQVQLGTLVDVRKHGTQRRHSAAHDLAGHNRRVCRSGRRRHGGRAQALEAAPHGRPAPSRCPTPDQDRASSRQ